MIPVLFAPKAREYNNNGLGVLVDVGYCTVTEERNGAFELELQYPVNGSHYSDLAVDCQILAKPNETSDPQAFRIYNISKPMNGVVTVSAEHISYELSSIIVKPFSASNISEALSKIKSNSIGENPFQFWTDKSTTANMSQSAPLSARSLLGGAKGSVLDTYTGEYEFDNYTVKLHQNRGADNGVVISYAKNLTGVKCDERSDGIVTGVIGYWTSNSDTGNAETVMGDLQSVETNLSYSRNVVVDFSSEYENKPTKEQINSLSKKHLDSHKNVPYFSVSVEFVNLGDTEEYSQYKGLYRVRLCDTVTVKHPLYGIYVKSKVVKTVFDSVREKYEKIEIGEVSSNISQTIANQEKEISQKVGLSELDKAVANATNAIAGNKGGYVVLYPSAVNPQELLILDKPNVSEAVNVWRWNLAGLGHSSSGYNGNFTTAITADGQIVADFITTGTLDAINLTVKNLSADSITSGSLTSKNGLSHFNLNTGNAVFGGGDYSTSIEKGSIRQILKSFGGEIGGLVPTADPNFAAQTIYYNSANSKISGVTIARKDANGVFTDLAVFNNSEIKLRRPVSVTDPNNAYRGIKYYRYYAVGDSYYHSVVSVCAGEADGEPTITLDQYDENDHTDVMRLDVFRPSGEAYVAIRGFRSNKPSNTTGALELGREKMWWNGSLVCYGDIKGDYLSSSKESFGVSSQTICLGAPNTYLSGYRVLVDGSLWASDDISGATITNRSDRKIKKNIKPTKTKNSLSVIKGLKIYDYDLKDSGKSVKMGLMADEAPEEILSNDGYGINLYSYCGMLAMAVKELSEKVEEMERIGGNYGRES